MEDTSKEGSFFKDWVLPLAAAVIIAIIVNKTLFYMIEVPSTSMYPTIKVGDRLLVTKVYKPEKLKRGNIVVFKSKELGLTLVKRLVALPGETVDIDDMGDVFIDGKKLDEPYVIQKGLKAGHFKVPEGCYLFLGDNRRDSDDARYWKNPYISSNDIMGKAQFILFPFNRVTSVR